MLPASLKNTTMTLTRTFHPIGQGAFYTERHNINGIEFTVVYDCGSTTLKGEKLETKIKSTFPKNHSIDILFISHFHSDHINGIETLKKNYKIKKVVLPLIDDDAKTLLKISNYISDNNSDTQLIDNPTAYFGDGTTVITVSETNLNEGDNGINIESTTDISTLNPKQPVASGTAFISGLANHDWLFIPFNYKHIDRKTQFIASLTALGLTLTDLDTIEKIATYKDKIREAYNDIDGDLNENSMLLFSGKNADEPICCFAHHHHFFYHYHFDEINSSCIYFGDINLKQLGIVNDINKKLVRLLPHVGTIQVPHHGSIHNFDSSILKTSNVKCAILSFGTTNTYGHPSDRVIGEILSSSVFPYLVTEKQYSMVTQWK